MYFEPRQTSKMEHFAKIVNGLRELIEKNAIIDFLLKERSKPVSYKKENQDIITDANQENEEGTKPRNSTEKKNGNQ